MLLILSTNTFPSVKNPPATYTKMVSFAFKIEVGGPPPITPSKTEGAALKHRT
tara:strand:- start:227 stop:385 length:159 start_codon:yes stop_codon:yes gene_type:complete